MCIEIRLARSRITKKLFFNVKNNLAFLIPILSLQPKLENELQLILYLSTIINYDTIGNFPDTDVVCYRGTFCGRLTTLDYRLDVHAYGNGSLHGDVEAAVVGVPGAIVNKLCDNHWKDIFKETMQGLVLFLRPDVIQK